MWVMYFFNFASCEPLNFSKARKSKSAMHIHNLAQAQDLWKQHINDDPIMFSSS